MDRANTRDLAGFQPPLAALPSISVGTVLGDPENEIYELDTVAKLPPPAGAKNRRMLIDTSYPFNSQSSAAVSSLAILLRPAIDPRKN